MDQELTSNRKRDHVDLCLNKNVKYKNKTNGFEYYDFIHDALTEVEYEKIDLSLKFYGKKISYPFIISSMTGGFKDAENINQKLAEVAAELNIPLGVGSQRQILENSDYLETFHVVRKNAPGIPLLSNIGGAEIAAGISKKLIKKIIDIIEADALIIHLNPLQELIQPEGNIRFKGIIQNIEKLRKTIEIPIIVKEVGSGISHKAAKRLLEIGVDGIDVAGSGGTSWAGVELLRKNDFKENDFWDWGLPTSYCIKEVKKLKKTFEFTLIASGGISSGMEAAKALSLGADLVASARPILLELDKNGPDGVKTLILDWMDIIKRVMFLTGSPGLSELRKKKLFKLNKLY